MDKKCSVKKICEKIWEIEKKENLFSYSIDGIYLWELIRMDIYYEITEKLGIFGIAHSEKKSKIKKLKVGLKLLKTALINNPFLGGKNVDYLIYDHRRKIKVKNRFVDIYSYYFLKEINKNYMVLEDSFKDEHLTDSSEVRYHNDLIIIISEILSKFSKIREEVKLKEFISKLSEIESYFQVELSFKKKLEARIKKHKIKYFLYKKLLKSKNVKEVFTVVNYAKGDFVRAAKDLNIKVNEFQHGTISKYHLGYSYPYGKSKLKYFPDKLYTFGKYWEQFIPNNIETENYGFKYFRETQLSKKKKVKNQIVFLSQGVIGEKLSEMAVEISKNFKKYKVIYKLHPSEYNRWNQYLELYKNKNLVNLEIIDNNEKNLYELLNESEYQVGVFSTAIYEGLAYECKTLLYNLPGIEYMKELIDGEYCYEFNDLNGFREKIERGFEKKINSNDFF